MSEADELRLSMLAFAGTLHDLGNCLHRIALEAAVLETRVPSEFHPALAAIRAEVRAAATAIRPLRRESGTPPEPSDVNLTELIRQTGPAEGWNVPDRPVWVRADLTDLQLLVRCLFAVAPAGHLTTDIAGVCLAAYAVGDEHVMLLRGVEALARRFGAGMSCADDGTRPVITVLIPTSTDADRRGPQQARGHD